MHGAKVAITSLEKCSPTLAWKRVNRPSWRSPAAGSCVTFVLGRPRYRSYAYGEWCNFRLGSRVRVPRIRKLPFAAFGTPRAGNRHIAARYRPIGQRLHWPTSCPTRRDFSLRINNWSSLCQQSRWTDSQSARQALDVVNRDVSHLALDMGNEGPVKTCFMGQLLLRPATLGAQTL